MNRFGASGRCVISSVHLLLFFAIETLITNACEHRPCMKRTWCIFLLAATLFASGCTHYQIQPVRPASLKDWDKTSGLALELQPGRRTFEPARHGERKLVYFAVRPNILAQVADVAELADAPDSKSSTASWTSMEPLGNQWTSLSDKIFEKDLFGQFWPHF